MIFCTTLAWPRVSLSASTTTLFIEIDFRVYGVIRCLEIISEASRRLPDNIKARHPTIEWKEMAAAGNIYRHEYEDVAERRIWSTVRLALPALRAVIESELAAVSAS